MNKILYISLLFISSIFTLNAQNQISGKILDIDGSPLKGVSVHVMNDPSNKAISNDKGEVLIFTDYKSELVLNYGNLYEANIYITEGEFNHTFTDEDLVNDLGYLNRSNKQLTQAVSTVRSEKLDENSSPDIYEKLYGQLAGLTVLQNTAWNGNPTMIIRGGATSSKREPLVIVDGFQRPMEYLSMSEIESVSVLKDGAATALYGSRGANGVIVVTTKRGKYRSSESSIQYTYGIGLPQNMPEMADAYGYANAMNEALYYDGLSPKYSKYELNAIRDNAYPNIYPNVNWLDEGLRQHTVNHQLNTTFSGGGERVRHFTTLEYSNDKGILGGTNHDDRYSSQMEQYALNLRINLDVDITKTTKLSLGILGMLRETNKPAGTEQEDLIKALYSTPALAFPIMTESGVWGSDNIRKSNPLADIGASGYYQQNQRLLQSNLSLNQDLSVITNGLNAELAVYWDNMATNEESQKKSYIYEITNAIMDPSNGQMSDVSYDRFGLESPLTYDSGLSNQYMAVAFDAKLNYEVNFADHLIKASAIYRQESNTPMGRNSVRKYQSLLGVVDYSYSDKYFVNLVANYYGSSVMSSGSRYKLYPALSAAWLISSEDFMKGSAFDLLKLRASAGQSGNITYGYDLDKLNWDGGSNYLFGSSNASYDGFVEKVLANNNLTCETSTKYNVGIDLEVFNRLSVTADVYSESRDNILLDTDSFYSSILGITPAQSNDGKVNVKGVETSISWRDNIGDFTYSVGGNFSYAKSEIIENNEGKLAEDYLSQKGSTLGQFRGLESIGFFNDWEDIENSPTQTFSDVRPGDIKYRDINGDDVINANDVVAQGYSTKIPEIYYGISIGLKYKNFGVDALFQGVANYSVMLNTSNLYWPLYNNQNVSNWYLQENVRWTEQTKETATLPRLTTQSNENNFRDNSLWLRSGSYFKLRNLNIYYNLPQKWVSKIKMSDIQIYARANNLFSIDDIDYHNSEGVNINYPDLMSIYLGVNLKF